VIEMKVTTRQAEGLLFWHGQTPDVPLRGQDYLAIAIRDGHVVFSYELGSGSANISSAERIDDGRPHLITAARTGKYGSLTLDGFSYAEGESAGSLSALNTNGNIYIGGLPEQDSMTAGRYPYAFTGCVEEVYINGLGPLDFGLQAVSGVNVTPCNS